MRVLAIVCPGQGSQTPGFLTPWLDVAGVGERLRWLSAVSGLDLVAHGTTSDADTIRDTAVAQPLIVAAGGRRRVARERAQVECTAAYRSPFESGRCPGDGGRTPAAPTITG